MAGNDVKSPFFGGVSETRHPLHAAGRSWVAFDDRHIRAFRDRTQHQLSVQFSGLHVVGGNPGNDFDAIRFCRILRDEFVDVNNRKVFATRPGQGAVEGSRPKRGNNVTVQTAFGQPTLQDVELFQVCFFRRGAAEYHLHSQLLLRVLVPLLHEQEIGIGQTFSECPDFVRLRALP